MKLTIIPAVDPEEIRSDKYYPRDYVGHRSVHYKGLAGRPYPEEGKSTTFDGNEKKH